MSELNIKGPHIEVITGLHPRTCQTVLAEVRLVLGKSKKQYLSLKEFCDIKDVDIEYARERLKKFGLL